MIIAIDGPSGAGKSTLGKKLARELNLLYLDTGAMYRAAALAVIEAEASIYDAKEDSEIAENINVELFGPPDDLRVFLNGRDVTTQIRTPEISQAASIISTIPAVRRTLVDRQRELGLRSPNGGVLDGRDIGTIVFPNADFKFFLTATPESRARRRFQELKNRGVETTFTETLNQIIERDTRDASRHDSPLTVAPDAIVIDSTELSPEAVFTMMLATIQEKQKTAALSYS